MAKFLKLIEENKVSDLSSLVFNQKLSPTSTSTFTDVLSEEEEIAVVKKLLSDNTGEWKKFIAAYFEHYAPFNSAVNIMLENVQSAVVREVLKPIIADSGLLPDQARKLYEAVKASKSLALFDLLKEYCQNPKPSVADPSFELQLSNVDDLFADNANVNNVKLVDLYRLSLQKTWRDAK